MAWTNNKHDFLHAFPHFWRFKGSIYHSNISNTSIYIYIFIDKKATYLETMPHISSPLTLTSSTLQLDLSFFERCQFRLDFPWSQNFRGKTVVTMMTPVPSISIPSSIKEVHIYGDHHYRINLLPIFSEDHEGSYT